MKKLFILSLLCACTFQLSSQDDTEFSRKGRMLIETGYSLFAGFSGGTGLTVFSNDGSITSLGFDGGYMLSHNFALKFKLGLLNVSGGNLTNIGVGGKYYFGGKVPLDIGLSTLSSGGNSSFLGNITLGYAIPVAENINLEPSIGALLGEDDGFLRFGLNFSMFL